LAEAGEDGLVECDSCPYAANLEQATRRTPAPVVYDDSEQAMEPVATPDQRTIDEVAAFLKLDPARLVKTLVYRNGDQLTAVLVAGDREVNEVALKRLLGAEAELAPPAVIEQVAAAPVGFVGPVGLTIPVLADTGLQGATGLVVGANRAGEHLRHVSLARDAGAIRYEPLVLARSGDGCPRCGGTLREARGIEVGHVFKLGTKYSEKLGALYLDAQGTQQPMVMGCYGIGVTRTLQSIIEQSHDEQGIVWPISIAPYEVTVMAINVQHAPSAEKVDELVRGLEAAGVDVLVDDRDERPGVKFKDVDLVGTPIRVCVGERSLARGEVEIKDRKTGEMSGVPVDGALEAILDRVRSMRAALQP
jgi:prolyl-tRNA synthetase